MSFYCEKRVKAGRKQKTCSCCGATIEIGQPSITVPSTYFDGSHHLCEECYDKLEDEGIDETEVLETVMHRMDEDGVNLTEAIHRYEKEK